MIMMPKLSQFFLREIEIFKKNQLMNWHEPGRNEARPPESIRGTPTISIGNGCQYLVRGVRKGAQAQKILAKAEHVPRAWVLIFVG